MFKLNATQVTSHQDGRSDLLLIDSDSKGKRSILDRFLFKQQTTVEIPEWTEDKNTYWLTTK